MRICAGIQVEPQTRREETAQLDPCLPPAVYLHADPTLAARESSAIDMENSRVTQIPSKIDGDSELAFFNHACHENQRFISAMGAIPCHPLL